VTLSKLLLFLDVPFKAIEICRLPPAVGSIYITLKALSDLVQGLGKHVNKEKKKQKMLELVCGDALPGRATILRTVGDIAAT
jgi:hypothetical protein